MRSEHTSGVLASHLVERIVSHSRTTLGEKTGDVMQFFRSRTGRQSESGFTLIELLVVMLIIGVLAAIALPYIFNQDTEVISAEVCSVSGSSIQLPEEAGGTYTLKEGQSKPVPNNSYHFKVDSTNNTIKTVEPLREGDEPISC